MVTTLSTKTSQNSSKRASSSHVSVILPIATNIAFSYKNSKFEDLCLGQIVEVPFKNSIKTGVILNFNTANLPEEKLKQVANTNDIILSSKLLDFLTWSAKYYLAPLGMLVKSVISPLKDLKKINNYQAKEYTIDIKDIKLNPNQQEIADKVSNNLRNSFNVSVLEGVTGSGKTEVYIAIIAEQIKKGGQILVMLPEIMLSNQIMERFKARLGDIAIEWHSGLTPKVRQENWLEIYKGNAKLVIGARSALFLPFRDLRLIVIDEEHDTSYKQEDNVVYNARDLAVVRAKMESISLLLCSATPSLETMHNVKLGKYQSFYLSGRFGSAKLPEIKIVNPSADKKLKDEILAPELLAAITNTLHNKLQSLVFINRRGYAPFSVCKSCGHKYQCPNCQFYLVYHKKADFLQCHHCAYKQELKACPKCGDKEKFNSYGFGAEKVYEYLHEKFPDAKISLVTSDSITTRKKAQKMLEEITGGNTDIVVGTQLISKGLHFPKLTTIGIVGIDDAFNSGDFRVLERTYQLLQQVSGRAGRDKFSGEVLIQCDASKSSFIEKIISNGGQNFLEDELENRKLMQMPPFSRIALIHASAYNEIALVDFMYRMANAMPSSDAIEILGPAPAPIYFACKKYRYRFIIKAPREINIQKFISTWLQKMEFTGNIQTKIDIDPYSFL